MKRRREFWRRKTNADKRNRIEESTNASDLEWVFPFYIKKKKNWREPRRKPWKPFTLDVPEDDEDPETRHQRPLRYGVSSSGKRGSHEPQTRCSVQDSDGTTTASSCQFRSSTKRK
jgi:hypothetical protein